MKMRFSWFLLLSLLGEGCTTTRPTYRRQYAFVHGQPDSASAHVAAHASEYAVAAGEEAVIPWLEVSAVAGAGTAATGVAIWVMSEQELEEVEEVLQECANEAEAVVNARNRALFGEGRTEPNEDDCWRRVPFGFDGTIELQRKLGLEKHAESEACVRLRMGEKYAGRMSTEQVYRVNPRTGKLELVSKAEVGELIRSGRKGELRGTIKPDLTFHELGGFPVYYVYDFKYPCPPGGRGKWSKYGPESPYDGKSQSKVYEKILGVEPRIISPQ